MLSPLGMKPTELWRALYHNSGDMLPHISDDLFNTDSHPPETEYHAWNIEKHDLVVIPSLSFSQKELSNIQGVQHYEERALYALFALSDPSTRLSIVTSAPLDEWILRYHFSLLPLHRREAYQNRVVFYSLGDTSTDSCLTEKLLKRPRLLERLKHHGMPSKRDSKRVMMIFRATAHEEKLARLLDIELYAARPDQTIYGTKHGSRSIFRSLGIPCADGTYEAEKDLNVLKRSIWKVLRRDPGATKGVVKLADSFSGIGNAIIDVTTIQQRLSQIDEKLDSTDEALENLTRKALETMTFHCHNWTSFFEELKEMGGIFELFIDFPEGSMASERITSPSAQVVISEDGSVSVLSTHEQMLEDQVYHGCEFPCRIEYRTQLIEYAQIIGDYLSSQNVRDRFGVDFVCVPGSNNSEWDIFAVEINLRMTGTTPPWMTMKLLTHGHTDPITGLFTTPSGRQKSYVSSDNVSDPSLKRLIPQDLYELMMNRRDLHWDPDRQTGVVFHVIGRMPDCGTLSMTAIENSMEDAHILFSTCRDYILTEAKRQDSEL
jgi:hypothetical protein